MLVSPSWDTNILLRFQKYIILQIISHKSLQTNRNKLNNQYIVFPLKKRKTKLFLSKATTFVHNLTDKTVHMFLCFLQRIIIWNTSIRLCILFCAKFGLQNWKHDFQRYRILVQKQENIVKNHENSKSHQKSILT